MRQNCILYVDNDLDSENYFVAFWDEIEKAENDLKNIENVEHKK